MRRYCTHCDLSRWQHILKWLEALIPDAPPFVSMQKVEAQLLATTEYILTGIKVAHMTPFTADVPIEHRTRLFLQEAQRRGYDPRILTIGTSHTSLAKITIKSAPWRFSVLPQYNYGRALVDSNDKSSTKRALHAAGFPVVKGETFLFWQWHLAQQYGESLGYPLVVKPVHGSVARHVTINIRTALELRRAIGIATSYSPSFIVEPFQQYGHVYRLTVIGDEFVFALRQTPPQLCGDGKHTIQELITIENENRKRVQNSLTKPIMLDESVRRHISTMQLSLEAILPTGVCITLRNEPHLALGGELEDVSETVNADIVQMSKDITRTMGLLIAGIDMVLEDITKPWHEQNCAILEVNAVPSIEMHHFPLRGSSQDVASALLTALEKISAQTE